jgi:hypothetical protein
VAVKPIYGVKQRPLLALLENVICPTGVGLVLDIDLVIPEVRFPPLLADYCREFGD